MAPRKINKIQFKVGPKGIIPCRAHASDAGYDLYASEDVLLWGNSKIMATTPKALDHIFEKSPKIKLI